MEKTLTRDVNSLIKKSHYRLGDVISSLHKNTSKRPEAIVKRRV